MKISLSLIVLGLLLVALCSGASQATGKWDCVATSSTGEKINVVMDVTDADGKPSGVVVMSDTGEELKMVEPTLEGARFGFKVFINNEPYQVDLKIDGKKVSGKYAGKEAGGTIEGTKRS